MAALLALQGVVDADWCNPANAALARKINGRAMAIAQREMEPGLSASDFVALLAAAARRAEADARS
ncbi:hypothetical protein [Rhodoligotrophos defluvii]|uniref:hypothetical protein n=1 Tax=Rhodoligotrophos defluvii TaxID=2561934 RepID=UPI0014857DBD|nr:hypothetical protein [Rhodoligotrophos defluvii]